jgi:hypothetical protein
MNTNRYELDAELAYRRDSLRNDYGRGRRVKRRRMLRATPRVQVRRPSLPTWSPAEQRSAACCGG